MRIFLINILSCCGVCFVALGGSGGAGLLAEAALLEAPLAPALRCGLAGETTAASWPALASPGYRQSGNSTAFSAIVLKGEVLDEQRHRSGCILAGETKQAPK